MNDNEIIENIARMWVALGGDDIGFDYCADKIKNRITEIMEEKNE